MPPNASGRPHELLLASLRFTDPYWDEKAGLIRSPTTEEDLTGESHRSHLVRETGWYALGLLMRGGPGDRDRAVRALGAVADQQFDAPGRPWDGTFRRAPEEPEPGPKSRSGADFDPNWREFIGTTFALVRIRFNGALPAALEARLDAAIVRAAAGETAQHRLTPGYTNIALMRGFLWGYAGRRAGREEWVASADAWMDSVYALYRPNGTFEEYNSPTYGGVDLFGLALCRSLGVTPRVRELGARMEAGLWRDIAEHYHAGLRNLCGPFDRSYGMDMRRYVSLVGAWIGLAEDAARTPLPDPAGPMDHAHDFTCVPTYVAVGTCIPPDALAHLGAFQGEREITRRINATRVATSWIGRDVMLGGESTGLTRAAEAPKSQFHAATVHWRAPSGEVGWIRLWPAPRVDARASKDRLEISTVAGDSTFEICVPGLDPARVTRDVWDLPGLSVRVSTDARDFSVAPPVQAGSGSGTASGPAAAAAPRATTVTAPAATPAASPAPTLLRITYRDATRFALVTER